jgi:hypothetical protein
VYNGGDIMELNPIKRIKLYIELIKNDKQFKKNSIEFKALSETFREIYEEDIKNVDDGTIKALETIKNKEGRIIDSNEALLKRDDEIYKLLYGKLF